MGEVGVKATLAAQHKKDAHDDAVKGLGHSFHPFAMEVYGHLDESCHDVLKYLSNHLLPWQRHRFRTEMLHAVSVALARGRAHSVASAVAKMRASETFLNASY